MSKCKVHICRFLIVLLITIGFSHTVLAQNLSVNRLIDLLGVDNPQAFDELVKKGVDIVPELEDALDKKWPFHAYIRQRTNVIKVLAAMNHIETVPALKRGLIMEQTIRDEAIEALLNIPELSVSILTVELLQDQVDYQAAQLEMFRKLLQKEQDIIAILDEVFAILATNPEDSSTIDNLADFLARFIIEDKTVVEPPKPITREMILAALAAQQKAAEQSEEVKDEKIDVNQQLFSFLIKQVNHQNYGNRRIALRTIGRFTDLVRVTEQADRFSLSDFVPYLITVLLEQNEDMHNRILAARALEQIVPASDETLEAFMTVLLEADIESEVKWSAIRSLEKAGLAVGEHVQTLISLVPELEPAMRWRLASLFVIGARNDLPIIEDIVKLLDNQDQSLRFYGIQLLGAIGNKAIDFVPILMDQMERTPNLSDSILKALAKIAPNQAVVVDLVKTLPDLQSVTDKIPAFPGAEGRGAYASGGRGGEVYIVTNINNAGPGSLRDGVSKPNRTIVFEVSGTIELRSQLKTAANITIAGQTAPGDGITVADYPTVIGGNNIVRYLRFRLGERTGLTGSDALNIDRYVSDVILDHISVSWGNDEVLSTYDNQNITIQYSMIGEGLNYVNHSAVGLWGPRASYHHNLIYSNKTRHPKLAYLGDTVDFSNNVIYNWRERSVYTGSQGRINMVANYLKPGPATYSSVRSMLIEPDGNDVRIYLTGNIVEGSPAVNQDNWKGVTKSAVKMSEPFATPPLTLHSAEEAYEIVLAHAGASLPKRDAVDQRIITDVINGTGDIILRQSEVGGFPIMNSVLAPVDSDRDGMPDMWEIYYGLDPYNPADRNDDHTGDGYTNLEKYLNALTEEHELWP